MNRCGSGVTPDQLAWRRLFQQLVEIGCEAITKAEFMLAGQAMEQGNEPADQV